jgi:hypothetical protein
MPLEAKLRDSPISSKPRFSFPGGLATSTRASDEYDVSQQRLQETEVTPESAQEQFAKFHPPNPAPQQSLKQQGQTQPPHAVSLTVTAQVQNLTCIADINQILATIWPLPHNRIVGVIGTVVNWTTSLKMRPCSGPIIMTQSTQNEGFQRSIINLIQVTRHASSFVNQ